MQQVASTNTVLRKTKEKKRGGVLGRPPGFLKVG